MTGPVCPSGTSITSVSNGSSVTPVVIAENHMRLADRQFIAFAPHGLDEHGEMQDAAARDRELFGARDGFHAQRDVLLNLLEKPLSAGDDW